MGHHNFWEKKNTCEKTLRVFFLFQVIPVYFIMGFGRKRWALILIFFVSYFSEQKKNVAWQPRIKAVWHGLGHCIYMQWIPSLNWYEKYNFGTYFLLSIWYCGLRITNNLGRICIKTLFTHGAITWVVGDRKCIFNTTTVTQILKHIKHSKSFKLLDEND